MNRGGFLKRLFTIPFAVKAIAKKEEQGLPKDKDGFYITKKEFEQEVRKREYDRSFRGITISSPDYLGSTYCQSTLSAQSYMTTFFRTW